MCEGLDCSYVSRPPRTDYYRFMGTDEASERPGLGLAGETLYAEAGPVPHPPIVSPPVTPETVTVTDAAIPLPESTSQPTCTSFQWEDFSAYSGGMEREIRETERVLEGLRRELIIQQGIHARQVGQYGVGIGSCQDEARCQLVPDFSVLSEPRIASLESRIGANQSVLWLALHEAGILRPMVIVAGQEVDLFNQIISSFRHSSSLAPTASWAFWQRQLAMVLGREIESPRIRGYLAQILPHLNDVVLYPDRSRRERVTWREIDWNNPEQVRLARIRLLEHIYAQYLQSSGERHPYALMESQNLFDRAMLAQDRGERMRLLRQAGDMLYGRLVPVTGSDSQLESLDLQSARTHMPPFVVAQGDEAVSLILASASVQMARLRMAGAYAMDEPLAILEEVMSNGEESTFVSRASEGLNRVRQILTDAGVTEADITRILGVQAQDRIQLKAVIARLQERRLMRLEQARMYLCHALSITVHEGDHAVPVLQRTDQWEVRAMLGEIAMQEGLGRRALGQNYLSLLQEAARHLDAVISMRDGFQTFMTRAHTEDEERYASGDRSHVLMCRTEPRRLMYIVISALIARAQINMAAIAELSVNSSNTTLAILDGLLTDDDRRILQSHQEAAANRVIWIQRRLLVEMVETLRSAVNISYTYVYEADGQPRELSVPIIPRDQAMVARLLLVEIAIRQAFFSAEADRAILVGQILELNAILASDSHADFATQAAARRWLRAITPTQ